MSSELRACQHCKQDQGAMKTFEMAEDGKVVRVWQMQCFNCRVSTPAFHSAEEAIEDWNKRQDRAPMELTDSELVAMFTYIDSEKTSAAIAHFRGTDNETQSWEASRNEIIANAARQWLAERSGG